MARVVVAGWIGSTNLGDELVLKAMLRKLRDREATVIAVSTDPEATRRDHGLVAVDHRRVDEVARLVASADAVVFGGGQLLQDETSHFNLPYHLHRVGLARARGVPVAMVGVGAGPLRSRPGRELVRRAFEGAVHGSVRDRDSVELLTEVGLAKPELAADLAVSLPTPEVARRDVVAVCLRPWAGGGALPVSRNWDRGLHDDAFLDAVASALDEVAGRTGLGIHFVAFQAGRDDRLHDLVRERMRTSATSAVPGLARVVDEVAQARVAISVRYHGAIAATLGGVPSVLLGYSGKVRSLADELGRGASLTGWSRDDVAALPRLVDDVLDRDEHVLEARSRLRVRELGNDDALDRLLAAASRRGAA